MASRTVGSSYEGRDERVKSVGKKLLSRMKTALRRGDQPKRVPTMSMPACIPEPATGPSTDPTTTPAASQPPQPTAVPIESTTPQVKDDLPSFDGEKVPRSQIYGERARNLSERYGLEMNPHAWYQMEGHVLRVHKPVRMRVHRQCHQCGHKLTHSGSCDSCKHTFCAQCTRNPPRRTEAETAASRERRDNIARDRTANAMIVPDWDLKPKQNVVLSRPGRPGGQELVYKKIRQRVRRTCCQCLEACGSEVTFQGGRLNCPKCDHARCTDCPRDPPKKDKYPYGYPGDEFGARSIPYYQCHRCNAKFPPGAEDGTECVRCSHEKCDNCERVRPHKVEPEADPEVLKSVQEKLAAMNLS
ncbi:hypothetical protein VP1G_02226 [Cytospora mali]|uniref:Uncharacterized protein n=1 Tax=Cytospora mali TaxID=578113 RepID=A0A194UT16_CYTMA|nr:hypothetical protein VP1G_02226 [Valsa mali var. pyri (nom. inval.)]